MNQTSRNRLAKGSLMNNQRWS